MVEADLLYQGSVWRVFVLVSDGKSAALQFLSDDATADERRQLIAVIRRVADHDQRSNPHRFKDFMGSDKPLCEFKWEQVRLLAFYDGTRRIIVTHGFKKKQDETPPREKQRALSMREQFIRDGRQTR